MSSSEHEPRTGRTMRRYLVPFGETTEAVGLASEPSWVGPGSSTAVAFFAEHPGSLCRRYQVLATGEAIPDGAVYRGSCQGSAGSLETAPVLHLFDVTGCAQ